MSETPHISLKNTVRIWSPSSCPSWVYLFSLALLFSVLLLPIFHCHMLSVVDVCLMVHHIKTKQNSLVTEIWCVGSLATLLTCVILWFVTVANWFNLSLNMSYGPNLWAELISLHMNVWGRKQVNAFVCVCVFSCICGIFPWFHKTYKNSNL